VTDVFAFISPAAARDGVALRTPMERRHVAAGARIEERDGWRVAVYEHPESGENGENGENGNTWIADVSHLGKLDVRGTEVELDELTGGLARGHAREDDGVWTLRLTPGHAYVLCPYPRVAALRERIGAAAVDVTSGLAGVALGGPGWRDIFNRSSGIDVRPSALPPLRCTSGSVMRVPTLILHDGEGVLMFVGWEYGEYFWDAILDAAAGRDLVAVTAGAGREAGVA
jgi:glycine cleavage system aminomethyltransferase T